MKKIALNKAVVKCKDETKVALQMVYDALNQCQQKKLVKDEAVNTLFDRYGVVYE